MCTESNITEFEEKIIKNTTGEADEVENVEDITALDSLFFVRDKQLLNLTTEDKEATKEITHKIQKQEEKIREELKNLQIKEEVVKRIIDIFNTYQTLSNDRNMYFNKKYYIAGFDDGEKIVLRNINK